MSTSHDAKTQGQKIWPLRPWRHGDLALKTIHSQILPLGSLRKVYNPLLKQQEDARNNSAHPLFAGLRDSSPIVRGTCPVGVSGLSTKGLTFQRWTWQGLLT